MIHWQTELEARLLALQPHVSSPAWTRAWAEFRLYSLYYRLGAHRTWQEIVAETDQYFAAVESLPDVAPRDLINLYFIGQFLYRRCGAAHKALTVFQRKMQLERDHGYPHVDEHGAGDLALIYWVLCEYDLAVAGYQRWLAWCEQNRDLHSQGISLAILAAVYLSQKRLAEAEEVLDRAEALAQHLESAYIGGLVQINRANVALCRADYPAAITDFEAGSSRSQAATRQPLRC
jgi:tetratricopeptide (TPR) repeat protein